MKTVKRNKLIRYIFTLIHFLSSFIYERLIFNFGEDRSVVLSIAKNDIISDRFEFIESYVLSKLFAFVFIFLLWKIIFFVIFNFDKTMTIHITVFVIGAMLLMLSWPRVFTYSEDNYITLSYALRFYPEYWHSAYSSFIYAGLMMVFPHPFAITLLQWLFYVAVLGYISVRVKEIPVFKGKWIYVAYFMLLVPEWFMLISNAYRTEQYAILCTFYVSLLILDCIEKRKRSAIELIGIAVLSAFVSVWRNEGVVLGFLAFLTVLVFSYKKSFKKICLYMSAFFIMFIMISMPQKLGDKKYYGKDYSFINSFPTLCNILNANEGLLKEYDGLTEDIAAIEAVTPVNLIKMYGMEGYRRYNYFNNREDINQSLCDADTSAAYMKAYYRLVLHNPIVYAKTQISMLLHIAGIKDYVYIEHAHVDESFVDLPNYNFAGWNFGKEDLNEMFLVDSINNSNILKGISSAIIDTILKVRSIIKKLYVRTFIVILIPVLEVFMVIYELICLIKRKPHNIGLGAFSLILLGQAGAISLVMPAGVIAYFHPYLYCSAILVSLYFVLLWNEKKKH